VTAEEAVSRGTERALRGRVEELRAAGVRNVLCTMVDSGSITRVKCFRLDDLEYFARSGTGFSILWALVLTNDHFTTTAAIRGPVGDMRMLPDTDALVQLAATPEWAWAPLDLYDQEGEPLSICPRQFLKRMGGKAQEQGFRLGMAYEFEWFLASVGEDGKVRPVHEGPGYSSNAWAVVSGFCRDLLDALAGQGIRISQLHPEYSHGQMEVSLGAADPLAAADWHVLFRHTVRGISQQYGWRSSFSPGTVPGLGNGCHLHFSLYDLAGENLFTGGERRMTLPEPCWVDPGSMTEQERWAAGFQQLPESLSEAADALAASTVLREALGELQHDCMVAVRRAEAEADEGRPIEELVTEQLWRF